MAFYTFKHPDFASKYRNYRLITKDDVVPPVAGFVAAETFETEDELRLNFRMTDGEWLQAQTRQATTSYFIFNLGGIQDVLPE